MRSARGVFGDKRRLRLVNQGLKYFTQAGAGAGHAGHDSADGNIKLRGHIGVGEAGIDAQAHDCAVFGGQATDGGEGLGAGQFSEGVGCEVGRFVIFDWENGRCADLFAGLIEEQVAQHGRHVAAGIFHV